MPSIGPISERYYNYGSQGLGGIVPGGCALLGGTGYLVFGRAARFSRAHPCFTICRARPITSESSGTSSVTQDAAPTYAPFPTRTGATKVLSLPIKTPSSITVVCLFTPS